MAMIEDAEQRGRAYERHRHRRADQRQHRHRAGLRRRGQGLQTHPHHARDDEARAPHAARDARREARPHAGRRGHEGRHRPRRTDRRKTRRTRGCRSSSTTRPIPRFTKRRPPRKSGTTRMARSTFSSRPSAPAARSPACVEVIKPRKPSFQAIAVEPTDSPVISQTLNGEPVKPGPHKIQGTGAGFVPNNLHLKDSAGNPQITECIKVSNDDAFAMARRLAKEEGILAGISTGANVGRRHRGRQTPGKQRQAHRHRRLLDRRALPLHRARRRGESGSRRLTRGSNQHRHAVA